MESGNRGVGEYTTAPRRRPRWFEGSSTLGPDARNGSRNLASLPPDDHLFTPRADSTRQLLSPTSPFMQSRLSVSTAEILSCVWPEVPNAAQGSGLLPSAWNDDAAGSSIQDRRNEWLPPISAGAFRADFSSSFGSLSGRRQSLDGGVRIAGGPIGVALEVATRDTPWMLRYSAQSHVKADSNSERTLPPEYGLYFG